MKLIYKSIRREGVYGDLTGSFLVEKTRYRLSLDSNFRIQRIKNKVKLLYWRLLGYTFQDFSIRQQVEYYKDYYNRCKICGRNLYKDIFCDFAINDDMDEVNKCRECFCNETGATNTYDGIVRYLKKNHGGFISYFNLNSNTVNNYHNKIEFIKPEKELV